MNSTILRYFGIVFYLFGSIAFLHSLYYLERSMYISKVYFQNGQIYPSINAMCKNGFDYVIKKLEEDYDKTNKWNFFKLDFSVKLFYKNRNYFS